MEEYFGRGCNRHFIQKAFLSVFGLFFFYICLCCCYYLIVRSNVCAPPISHLDNAIGSPAACRLTDCCRSSGVHFPRMLQASQMMGKRTPFRACHRETSPSVGERGSSTAGLSDPLMPERWCPRIAVEGHGLGGELFLVLSVLSFFACWPQVCGCNINFIPACLCSNFRFFTYLSETLQVSSFHHFSCSTRMH